MSVVLDGQDKSGFQFENVGPTFSCFSLLSSIKLVKTDFASFSL